MCNQAEDRQVKLMVLWVMQNNPAILNSTFLATQLG